MISTCAHTKTRSSASVVVSSAKSPRERVRHGRPVRRPGVQPERDAGACQRSSVVTIARDQREDEVGLAQMAPFEPARPLRSSGSPNADDDADEHENGEDVDEERVPALVAAEPRAAASRGRRSPTTAMKIVGKRTRKPQKMKACTSPGPSRCKSFRCPRTIVASFRPGAGRRRAVDGLARARTSRARNSARRAKSQPATAIAATSATADGDARRRAQPRAFRSSAEIAGTTSCRSPITA